MKNRLLPLSVATLALGLLAGCSTIRNWFPDKGKDYQYTTEIPALVLPPDLLKDDSLKLIKPPSVAGGAATTPAQDTLATEGATTEALPTDTGSPSAPAAAANKAVAGAEPAIVQDVSGTGSAVAKTPPTDIGSPAAPAATETQSVAEATASTGQTNAPPAKHEPIPVTMLKSADGFDYLRVGQPFENAWRTIDKALSRKSIEVSDRNKTEQLFWVHYDPDEQSPQEHSFWHDAFFMFNGFQSGKNEQEFIVKLVSNAQQTDVSILDKEQKPAKDAAAVSLLKLIQDTIKVDFAK